MDCLLGDNTDWIGIVKPVQDRFVQRSMAENPVGLVIGAGGAARAACYALRHMNLRLVVHNPRTHSKAVRLAADFSGTACASLVPEQLAQFDVVVSTVPGNVEFVLPDYLLQSKPVVMDAAYKPAKTDLLLQAAAADCPVIYGVEMLIEQGMAQFQLWTDNKTKAPCRTAVYDLIMPTAGL